MRAKHRLARAVRRHHITNSLPVPGVSRPGNAIGGLNATRAAEAAIKGATAGITRALTAWLLDHWPH